MAANTTPKPRKKAAPKVNVQINLYEAKTQLSSLVDRASKGEEIVIAKSGKPMARLIPLAEPKVESEPLPFGKNLLGITFIADDFDEDLPPEMFENSETDYLFRPKGSK